MTRRGLVWTAVAVVALLLLFGLLLGGFFWPRPQFERGPWATPPGESAGEAVPADTIADSVVAPPGGR